MKDGHALIVKHKNLPCEGSKSNGSFGTSIGTLAFVNLDIVDVFKDVTAISSDIDGKGDKASEPEDHGEELECKNDYVVSSLGEELWREHEEANDKKCPDGDEDEKVDFRWRVTN